MNRKFWIIALVIGFLTLLFESAGAFGRIGEKAILGGIAIGLLTFFVFIYAYVKAWRKRGDKPKAEAAENERRAKLGY
jgi:predicted RND superfamily exporter protein